MYFQRYEIPDLKPAPSWWRVRPEEITSEIGKVVKGKVRKETVTPLGYPVWSVLYGDEAVPEKQKSNWSSASYSGLCECYNTRGKGKQTVVFCAGIHGAEPEGTATALNLISLFETGKDLTGRTRNTLLELAESFRILILPCVNMDGRSISPDHLDGASHHDFRYASQGLWADGSLIGWPECKQYFPLPLEKVLFPGGYPNSEGYNIMHDACPGDLRTKEAKAVLNLAVREESDLFLNIHSGSEIPCLMPPGSFNYPENIRRTLRLVELTDRAFVQAGYSKRIRENQETTNALTLNNALTLACGTLAVTYESPLGGFSFEERIDMEYLLLETVLEDGLRKRYADRYELIQRKGDKSS